MGRQEDTAVLAPRDLPLGEPAVAVAVARDDDVARRVSTPASLDAAGPATRLMAKWGWRAAFGLGLAVVAWAGFGVIAHGLAPQSWRYDTEQTAAAVSHGLARLAPPRSVPLRERQAAWNARILAALEQPDGPDPLLAEAWLHTAPLILGEAGMAALGAPVLGHAPPFPGLRTRRDGAAHDAAVIQAVAAQRDAARGRFGRYELALASPAVQARFAAAGAEAHARGFVPGAGAGVDRLRLPAGAGLRRELVLYGDVARLVVQICALARTPAPNSDAPAACSHPAMPQPPLDRGALALAGVAAALSVRAPAAADAERQAVLAAGAGVLQEVRDEGLRRGLARSIDRRAQLALDAVQLQSAARDALEAAEASASAAAALGEALSAAAAQALVSPEAAPLTPLLAPLGAVDQAVSRATARRLVGDARDLGHAQRRATVAALAGPPALALAQTHGDLGGFAARRLVGDAELWRDGALLLAGLMLSTLALRRVRRSWRAPIFVRHRPDSA